MFFSFLMVLSSLPPGFASDSETWIQKNNGNCLVAHLREAIIVNQWRRKEYSQLTRGRSRMISNSLISFDKVGLLFARSFDRRSRETLSQNGFPFLCEVIPSMLPVLKRKIQIEAPVSLSEFVPFSASVANRQVRHAYRQGGLIAAQNMILKLKSELEQNPRFNCMARQFVLSMNRSIEVARLSHSKKAERLVWDLIQSTLLQLRLLVQLDRMAAPLQAQGVPILCSELPELPNLLNPNPGPFRRTF